MMNANVTRRARVVVLGLSLALSACTEGHEKQEHHREVEHPIVLTSPVVKDVPTTRAYVCQIHSRRNVKIRALEEGYLLEIPIEEGQAVREGQVLFQLLPVVYRAKLEADRAELRLAEIKLRNTERLTTRGVVSDQEVQLATAERDKAAAKLALAEAKYGFTQIVAPFDGIVDRQLMQQGSLIEEGDVLTTLSDNSVMWVYFNVPEADYLRFKTLPGAHDPDAPQKLVLPGATIQLQLATGALFDQTADPTITVESQFDNATGNVKFRADFPNPQRLLRHGQTGTLRITEVVPNALVIPQRATFEILDRHYVYVVDDAGVAHQREISIARELEDIYVIKDGISAGDKLVFEGIRQVRDGQKLAHAELRPPEQALGDLKHHAE